MKKLSLIIAALAVCIYANAQYNHITYNTESAFKIIQVDQFEDASLIYMSVISDGVMQLRILDNTTITSESQFKKYRILSTGNMPLSSEDVWAYLDRVGAQLLFVIKTDKLPLDQKIQITEKEGSRAQYDFNFTDLVIHSDSTTDQINIGDFLAFTDYVETGTYTKGGDRFKFYNVNGVSVATHLSEEWFDFNRVGHLDISVVNYSGHRIAISPDNVNITAKKKNRDYETCPKYSASAYDDAIASENRSRVRDYDRRVNSTANSIADYRKYKTDVDDLGATLALGALEVLARASNQDKINDYYAQLENNREVIWNNYLQSVTLEDGETYGGFITFKDKKYEHYMIYITVNGHVYTFSING